MAYLPDLPLHRTKESWPMSKIAKVLCTAAEMPPHCRQLTRLTTTAKIVPHPLQLQRTGALWVVVSAIQISAGS